MDCSNCLIKSEALLVDKSSTLRFTSPNICLNSTTFFSNCLWELLQFSRVFLKFSSSTKLTKYLQVGVCKAG
uniref:Uncharacterized protein n=1 Tax=Rhizophora mucronata TaxID=61149 RepID=A0A2P2N4U2_RHIMU